jgi:hypothetical protein
MAPGPPAIAILAVRSGLTRKWRSAAHQEHVPMHLIPEWKKAWKMFSMQFAAAAAAVQVAVLSLPESIRQFVPDRWMHVLAMFLLIGAMVGRLIRQDRPDDR